MKIDWKYWLTLFVFIAMQAGLIYSIRADLDQQLWEIKQDLSNQIYCQLSEECKESN